jgi:hypothetical protein
LFTLLCYRCHVTCLFSLRVSRDREHGFHRIVSKYFAGS